MPESTQSSASHSLDSDFADAGLEDTRNAPADAVDGSDALDDMDASDLVEHRGSADEPGRLGSLRSLMKIGELARKTGKTSRALHLYEEMGLLVPPRSAGGFRLYGSDELARVYWISKLQDMGFKLAQIKGLLDAVRASESAPGAMTGVRELFQGKLQETREQIERLRQLERDLGESLAYLEACRSCDEGSSHACASCNHDRHDVPEPTLVSGIHLSRKIAGEKGVSTP